MIDIYKVTLENHSKLGWLGTVVEWTPKTITLNFRKSSPFSYPDINEGFERVMFDRDHVELITNH